jgi:hypothetical protein
MNKGDKHQIPSTKHQINSNQQRPKFQTNSLRSLGIVIWNLFGIWNLLFEISRPIKFDWHFED